MDKTACPSARSKSKTHFRPASRSEDTRRILDSRSKVGNFKRAPVGGALFPNPRLRVRNEDEKCDSSEATVILSHRVSPPSKWACTRLSGRDPNDIGPTIR